jgi:hypothetical protein
VQERTSQYDERLGQWLKQYPEADANGDGILTLPEAEAFRQKRQPSGGAGSRKALTPTLRDVRYGEHPRQVLDFFRTESAKSIPGSHLLSRRRLCGRR